MVRVLRLSELAELAVATAPLYVRYSEGPGADQTATSVDYESGCRLPGLSVNPLNPEPWWDRPVEQWVARQLHQYAHLAGGTRYAWVLSGSIAGRGPDCEPLLADVVPVARLDDRVIAEAGEVYERELAAGRDSR